MRHAKYSRYETKIMKYPDYKTKIQNTQKKDEKDKILWLQDKKYA